MNQLHTLGTQCNRTAALYGLFTQLSAEPQPKVALIGSGCSSATAVTAEHAHFHNNITQVINFISVIISDSD